MADVAINEEGQQTVAPPLGGDLFVITDAYGVEVVATICNFSVSDNTSLIEYVLFDQKLASQSGRLIWIFVPV